MLKFVSFLLSTYSLIAPEGKNTFIIMLSVLASENMTSLVCRQLMRIFVSFHFIMS